MKSLPSVPANVLKRLEQVLEVCEQLGDWVDEISVVVDDVKQTLAELAPAKPELNPILPPITAKWRRTKPGASPVVRCASSVKLKLGQSLAELTIDGQTILLSQKLGMLVDLLLADADDSSDHACLGWKTRRELALCLGQRTRQQVSKHALENLICRLKKKLHYHGGLDALIQCDGPLLLRFASQKYFLEPDNPSSEKAEPPGEQSAHQDVPWGCMGEI